MTERDIFHAANEITDLAERSAYLERVCVGDPARREHVEGLLEAHARLGRFLEAPAVALNGDLAGLDAGRSAVIGPYKLLQPIGEGGMGTVYLAEQTQPVQRQVALKIVKPGMDSRQAIARFEAERQALALMDHPNIAKVLDAGTLSDRHPAGDREKQEAAVPPGPSELPAQSRLYFVMELVKGVPITKYCDDRHLPLRERLELFVPICQALQHAHQKGIIHRDLKPSNILVAEYDDKPVPKVIDFGVAKATAAKLTERTLFTQFGQIVGTVEYMSPEQAKFNALDIDTRSDIYGLGILLYELLTGTTPLEHKRVAQESFDEVLRVIREDDPPTPSNRLSTTAELPAIAANRGVEPGKLTGLVRGELDWIVMKCLEKDRNRRYDTAGALAADLERYLRDEPVQACPPSAWYRSRKFVRRNRAALTVAGLALLVLALLGGTGWMMRERSAQSAALHVQVNRALEETQDFYTRERQPEALAALKRAEALLPPDYVDEQLDARVRQWRTDLDMVALLERIRLNKAGIKIDNFDPRQTAAAYRDAFHRFGLDLGVLSADQAAERIRVSAVKTQLLAALDDWMPAAAATDRPDRLALVAIAQQADPDPWKNRVRTAWAKNDGQSLEMLAQDKVVLDLSPVTQLRLAQALARLDKRALAIQILRQAQRRHEADFWINHELAILLLWDRQAGSAAEAVGFFRAALALRPASAAIHASLGQALYADQRRDEAEEEFRAAIRLNPDFDGGHAGLARCLRKKGQREEAIKEYQLSLRLNPDDGVAHLNLGIMQRGRGRLDEAIAHFKEALRLVPKASEPHVELGIALRAQGRPQDAVAEFRDAIHIRPTFAATYSLLGEALADLDRLEDAAAAFRDALQFDPQLTAARRSLAIIETLLKRQDAVGHNNRAGYLVARKRLAEAESQVEQALRMQPDLAAAQCRYGEILHRRGKTAEGDAALHKVLERQPDNPEALLHVGNTYAALTQWDKAAADFARIREVAPDHVWASHRLALTYVAAQKPQEYRKLCNEMLEQYARTKSRLLAGMIVDASVLLPAATADPDAIAAIAEAQMPTNLRMQGAALYRAGKYEQAVKRFAQAQKAGLEPADWYIFAMAQHAMGQAREATLSFQGGVRDAEQTKLVDLPWTTRLREARLRAEAEALLKKVP